MASGASGGGFKDYGIFKNGVSYTVYLDMADAGLRGPNWAMQYGLDLRPSANSSDPPPRRTAFCSLPMRSQNRFRISLPKWQGEAMAARSWSSA